MKWASNELENSIQLVLQLANPQMKSTKEKENSSPYSQSETIARGCRKVMEKKCFWSNADVPSYSDRANIHFNAIT